MQLNQKKPRSGHFSTYRDRKIYVNAKSIEGKQMVEVLNSIQKLANQEQASLKNQRKKSFKFSKNSNINMNMAINYSFMDFGKQTKSKRTLVEENIELKRKLQSLASMKNTKKQQISRKISSQFQKQLYWNGNQTYMISGIKLQYQKIKENYQKKCDQYDQLLRSRDVASNMEFMSYIEALELQNHLLAKKIQNKVSKNAIYEEQIDYFTHQNLIEKLDKYENKIKNLRQKWKSSRNETKELKMKIIFLQKLLIEKNNNQHAAIKNVKRYEKQNVQLQKKYSDLQLNLKLQKQENTKMIEKIKTAHAQNLNFQSEKLIQLQKEQHQFIHRLQKENRYLHSLVDSWKQQKNPKNIQKKQSISSSKQKVDRASSSIHIQNTKQHQSKILESHRKHPDKKQLSFNLIQKDQEHQVQGPSSSEQRTTPYSADQKYRQSAVKNRRIQPYQIQSIIEYARFILIGKGLTVDWAVKQFDNENDAWSTQYINMKEARQTAEKCFQLNSNQALMLARYLIQHSNNEHVFTDDINEYSRTIVKSIIKSLLGEYSVYQDKKEQFEKVLGEWQSKLQMTFESTTKGGLISRQKFTDLIHSLSLSSNTGFCNYCIGKMVLHSESLDRLKYIFVFKNTPKQQ